MVAKVKVVTSLKGEILGSKRRRKFYNKEEYKCPSCGSINTGAYVLYTCKNFDIVRLHCFECHCSWNKTFSW